MKALLETASGNAPILARAIVRENNDPDKLGRVKVEYPWFHGDSAQLPSEWARICFPYASANQGAWILPEIGDEVLVLFENGNMDHPIVTGALYSKKNPPPQSGRAGDYNGDNKNNLKFIRTKAGHTLCFDDSADNEGIVLRDGDNRRFEIKSKEKRLEIADAAQNRITIEESSITIHHKSGDEIELKGGTITIKSSGKIELGEGAANSLVFGETFMTFFNSHAHMVPPGVLSGPPSPPMTPDMLSQKVKTS